jgi:hypothetical protein
MNVVGTQHAIEAALLEREQEARKRSFTALLDAARDALGVIDDLFATR